MRYVLLFLVFVIGCNKDLSPLNTTRGSVATPPVSSYSPAIDIFDDFENNFIGYVWSGGPNQISNSWSLDDAVSGVRSFKISAGPGTSWGHWIGLNGSSLSGGLPMSFPGATKIKIWIKVSQNVNIMFHWNEGYTSGANGEDWAYQINLTGSGSWQQITIPLSSFSGGISIEPQSVQSIWIDWNTPSFSPYVAHTIYIDDIGFEI